MTLPLAWQYARRWLWLVVLVTALAAAASFVVSERLPRVYEGTAKLQVTPAQTSNSATSYNDVLTAQTLTTTYAEVLKTRPIVDAATRQVMDGSQPANATLGNLSVSPVRNTQLIDVSAQASDPVLAAHFANAVAQSFIDYTQASQTSRYKASETSLGQQVDQLSAEISDHSRQIDALRAQPASAQHDTDLTRLQTELTQLQSSYTSAVQSYENARMAEARGTDLLQIVEPAIPEASPVAPKVVMNVALAAAVGLMLAAGLAFVLEYLDDRLLSPERLQRYTRLHMLGAVAQLASDQPRTIDRITTQQQPPADGKRGYGPYGGSHVAESFRLLQANLQFASVEKPLRSLLVTSTDAGDGKTTTAANLAIALAQAGKRVVLIDADLRRPQQHATFELSNRQGLTSLLVDATLAPEAVALPTRVANLSLIPSGPLPPNPSELLASRRMRDRLAQLCEAYDLVVVDSPPVRAVSDPAVLAGQVDGALLVVNAAKTRGQHAAASVATLQKAGANLLGAVLNRMPRSGSSYYGSYYHYSSYYATQPTQQTTSA